MPATAEPKTAQRNAAQPQRSTGYVDFDEYVDFQLEKTRHSIKWTDIVTATAVVAAFVVGYLLLFTILDHWLVPGGFGHTARFVMVGGLLAVTAAWLAWKVVLPYLKQVSGLYAARMIESSEPGLKSTLLNLVDLRNAGREIPQEIRGSMEKRAAQALSRMDVDQAVDRRPLMRAAYVLLGLVAFACLYSVISDKKISFARAFLPPAEVGAATRTVILELRTDPPLTRTHEQEIDVLARTQLEVVVDLSGQIPDEVTLHYTTADRKFVDEPVSMRRVEEGLKQFRGVLNGENGRGILQNTTFHVIAGDDISDEYTVLVNQPPSATVDEVRYVYPEYMEFENKTRPGGNVDAWEGTKVSISATVNQPVKSAVLQFFDDETADTKAEEIRMQVSEGNRLSVDWTLRFRTDGTFPRSYRIFCVNDEGRSDPEPTLYTQTIRPDRRPVVELLEPRGDLEVPANVIIPLLIEAHDPDFKLQYITLRRKKNGEVLPGSPRIFKGPQKEFRGTWDWDLKPLNLKVGDVVTYWVEARDNKTPLGNLSEKRQSLELHIIDRIPQEDADKQLDEDHARIKQRLEEAQEDENSEGKPEQQQQDASDEGKQGEDPQEGGKEPKPGEGKPKDTTDGNNKQDGKTGEDGKKPGDSDTKPQDAGNNKPSNAEDKTGRNEPGKNGEERRPLDTDGADDSDALRRLLERQRKQQEEQKQNDENKQQDNDGTRKPDDKGQQPDPNKPDEERADGKSPMNDPQGDGNKNENRKPGDQPDNAQKPGDEKQPDGGKKPEDGKEPKEGKKPADSGNQAGGNDKKGAEDKGNSQGKPTAADDDSSKKNQPGDGGEKTKPSSKNSNKTEKPLDGNEKPADDSKDAQRKKATGDERGPATAEDDKNADSTKAKNKLDRKSGEKPTTRPSEEKPTGDPMRKEGGGTGNENANKAKPAPTTKNGEQKPKGDKPDTRPTKPKEGDPNRPPARQDEQRKTDNEELKGDGRKDGQSSEKPQDGGEEGSGKPSDQGKPGGNKTDPGDSTNKPGEEEQADPSKPGKPGDERGDGSKKTDGSSKTGAGKPGGDPGKPSKDGGAGKAGEGKPGEAKPGKGGGKPGNEPKEGDGKSRGGGTQGPSGKSGAAGSDVAAEEKANLEYNRKAANLVLKRLQDDLDDGKTDQKLLDEFGWTKDDLRRYLERMERTVKQPGKDDSPKTEVQKQQVEEFLKGYNLRQGRSDRDQSSGGVAPRRKPVPAEFREAYDAFTRSISRKATRRNGSK